MARRNRKQKANAIATRKKAKAKREKAKAKREKKKMKQNRLNLVNVVLTQYPLHLIGPYLDIIGFDSFNATSATISRMVWKTIRARNKRLPFGKQITDLQGVFSATLKKLMKKEGHNFLDIIVTGGLIKSCSDFLVVNTVMSLDLVTKRYKILPSMKTARVDHATVVVNRKLYVFGGYNDDHFDYFLSSVECLDLNTMEWTELSPMIKHYSNFCAVALGDYIYLTGRSPYHGSIVTKLNIVTSQWTNVYSMNKSRYGHGIVSAQGMLFVVGGIYRDGFPQKSVECFNPMIGRWNEIAPLITARSELAVAVLGVNLYAIGGQDSQKHQLNSVECLDLSVPKSKWTTVVPMTTCRSGMKAFVIDGKIYVGGGTSSNIECFDPNDGPVGKWKIVDEITFPIPTSGQMSACVLPC